ncbi:aldo/keto reductase [Microbacterium kribbense]|uniref:Aldo/keto reductase n=1 Tax=Microbacterium kribbense TaxID=433645 RepID=A0ABP7GAF9_9MICO
MDSDIPAALRDDRLALGTSGLGRATVPGSAGEAVAVTTARALLTSRYAAVDTSNAYSVGRSEAVLGIALRDLGPDAAGRVITKVDADPRTGALDRDRVFRSVEESLRRLGVDRVPVLHLHDPYSITFADAMAQGGAVQALVELREEGVAGGIGIAAGPVPLVARYVGTGIFDAVLVHNRYTLVDRSAGPLFARAARAGMRVFNAAPFGAGILARGSGAGASYAYRPAPAALQQWVRRVEALCGEYRITLPAAALQFALRAPNVHTTVVGVSSSARLGQLDKLVALRVPDEFWQRLEALPSAPTPIDDSEESPA